MSFKSLSMYCMCIAGWFISVLLPEFQCRPFRLVKKRTGFRRCLICEKSEYFCIFYNILQKKILYRIHWEKTSKGIIVVLDLLIDTEEGSWVSCTANLGYPVGTILSGLLMDSIGRRTTALVFQVWYIGCSLRVWKVNSLTYICLQNIFILSCTVCTVCNYENINSLKYKTVQNVNFKRSMIFESFFSECL